MYDFYQRTSMHIHQPRLFDGFANMLVVRGHQQFHRIVGGGFEGRFRCLTVGQELAQGDDGEYADAEAEQARYGGGQHIHGSTGAVGIKTGYDQVRRCTNQRTHTSHTRGVAQRYK